MTVKAIDASVLRANLGDAIDEAKRGSIIEIRRHGKSEVALVDITKLEDWLAVQNPEYVKSIKEAREQVKKGQTVPHEEVFREIMGIEE